MHVPWKHGDVLSIRQCILHEEDVLGPLRVLKSTYPKACRNTPEIKGCSGSLFYQEEECKI